MHKSRHTLRTSILASTLMLAAIVAGPAAAHCDSMSGPVVKDAQIALARKSVDPVLKWVGKADEAAIREAFNMTIAVRGESATAQRVADTYFFETVVRIHRATEGEGYTGLKAAGNVDPAIAAAHSLHPHVVPLTPAELVQLRIRAIAVENLLIAVLAEGTDRQRQVAREMVDYIAPRPGATDHPLTIEAGRHMGSLIDRAEHFRSLEPQL